MNENSLILRLISIVMRSSLEQPDAEEPSPRTPPISRTRATLTPTPCPPRVPTPSRSWASPSAPSDWTTWCLCPRVQQWQELQGWMPWQTVKTTSWPSQPQAPSLPPPCVATSLVNIFIWTLIDLLLYQTQQWLWHLMVNNCICIQDYCLSKWLDHTVNTLVSTFISRHRPLYFQLYS